MSVRKMKATQAQLSSSSVYAQLGYLNADSMLIKAQLVSKIAEILNGRGLTQTQAAELLGLTQPKLSRLLRGGFRGTSERRLVDCLTKLGHDVQIVVKAPARSKETGKLSVVLA